MNAKVLAKLPRAGLGNKLLVWAHAYVFARENGLELMESGWSQISIGPYLRGERSKRRYLKQIRVEKTYWVLKYRKYKKVNVPKSNWMNIKPKEGHIYVFNELPRHTSYFDLLRDHRLSISNAFTVKVNADILNRANRSSIPLAIHIRMGDFKRFSKNTYDWDLYKKLIHDIREALNEDVSVTVFSDGWPEEIDILKSVKNISFWHTGNDLYDLIVMSRSRILVTYPGSTFSLWAGFIGQSILLHMNNKTIRSSLDQNYEGYPYTLDGALIPDLVKELLPSSDNN